MGIHDREWYRDRLRRATYAPTEFRSAQGPNTIGPSASPSGTHIKNAAVWLLVLAIGFAIGMAVLNHRGKASHLLDSQIPAGVPTSLLRIVTGPTSNATAVELVDLSPSGIPTGVVWRILVHPGQTKDREVPEGTYRIRVVQHHLFTPDTRVELPTLMQFRNSGTQRAGGTLTI